MRTEAEDLPIRSGILSTFPKTGAQSGRVDWLGFCASLRNTESISEWISPPPFLPTLILLSAEWTIRQRLCSFILREVLRCSVENLPAEPYYRFTAVIPLNPVVADVWAEAEFWEIF